MSISLLFYFFCLTKANEKATDTEIAEATTATTMKSKWALE